eukprot:CAMPEP_0118947250 /NCGR_PEP_ID=MMETSP1169-20130426/45672_1 /TAXON_ID=36882 /ORGANISM="Pyramimonas obovata, Strain CCMP722" /LENGTH=330 /DNA_ID=CAMNT_0006893427 /DNA_START=109 /DNA_END=1097 /DNA_ORIENTATION=-
MAPHEGKVEGAACKTLLSVWSAYVDSFINTCQAKGPAISPCREQAVKRNAQTYIPPVKRLIAIGDLHGDMEKTKAAFNLAGLTDQQGRWIGGDTTVVQVGDQLDRGEDEVAVLYFLERLANEAKRAGGALYSLNGNHETMNVSARFRYATHEGAEDFRRWYLLQLVGQNMKRKCGQAAGGCAAPLLATCPEALGKSWHPRYLALTPGGPIATRFLAHQNLVLQVGSTVFAHGGVRREHIDYGLDRMNAETAAWMRGEAPGWAPERMPWETMPPWLNQSSSVVWTRDFSNRKARRVRCEDLMEALGAMPHPAQRMVMGHTIQAEGINSACG